MKKFFSAILAICMLISANIAFADNIVSSDEPVIIKPEYVIISSIQTTFTISSSGRADCYVPWLVQRYPRLTACLPCFYYF